MEYPRAGQALQGTVEISGSAGSVDMQSAELSFAYDEEQPGTWFWIAGMDEPGGFTAAWDTTVLADGVYRLRLRITRPGGSTVDVHVRGLRVRNYTPVETDTPLPGPDLTASAPAPTPLPTVARVSDEVEPAPPEGDRDSGVFGMFQWLGYGVLGLVVVGLFALLRSLFQRGSDE